MPETKYIPTITIITVYVLSIEIYTFYYAEGSDPPYFIQFWLADTYGVIQGTYFIEGEGLCIQSSIAKHVSTYVNNQGELIIKSVDADQYSMGVNGNVVYTY